MPEYLALIILFFTGIAVGFINVMAGGGSTLSLPLLIFLGLDSATANGTNRIAILIQNMAAVLSFHQQKVSQFKMGLTMAVFTLPGAIIGAFFAVKISDDMFQKILGLVMIGIVLTLLFPLVRPSRNEKVDYRKKTWPIYPVMFGIGFYGGFIQAGVGYILMAAIYYVLRVNLVYVNMYKVFVIFIYTIPALGIFILSGNIYWKFGLVLAAGNATGAWVSARLAAKRGEKIIRAILIIAIILMALKLLDLF